MKEVGVEVHVSAEHNRLTERHADPAAVGDRRFFRSPRHQDRDSDDDGDDQRVKKKVSHTHTSACGYL